MAAFVASSMISGNFEDINVPPVHLAFKVNSRIKQHMYLVYVSLLEEGWGAFLSVRCLT